MISIGDPVLVLHSVMEERGLKLTTFRTNGAWYAHLKGETGVSIYAGVGSTVAEAWLDMLRHVQIEGEI